MKFVTLFLAGLFVTFAGSHFPANSAALTNFDIPPQNLSLLNHVAMKCVQIRRMGNRETLVNNCGSCRIVAVTRKRTGVAVPILRSFNVFSGIALDLPFKGPGRSRITTIQNCQSEEADAKDAKKLMAGNELGKCVTLKPAPNGSVLLANGCNTCRAVAVQRMDRNGRALNRQALRINPKDMISIKPNGAARVGLIAEIACPS